MGKNINANKAPEKQRKEKMQDIKKAFRLFPKIVAEQEKRHREGKPFLQVGLSLEKIMRERENRGKK